MAHKLEIDAKPMAQVATHDAVERIFKGIGPGKLLDIPAGEGALALRLAKLGFEVTCADLYPEIFKLDDQEIAKANLDEKMPFDDQTFDQIVCVEGLEHIENPSNAIREFSRVTKKGGTLVVSVPNIMNIEERLKWLLYGYTSHFKPLSQAALHDIRKEYGEKEEVAAHVNPIGYSEVRYLLEKNGFALVKTHRNKKKKNAWAYAPFVLLIKLINTFVSDEKRENRWTDELTSEEVLLGGNTLIFEAEKIHNE